MSSCSITRTKAPRSARDRRNVGLSSSTPAKIVADLDDILLQILSFLPIKTLLRSKRVSKRWLSLITNPDFSNRYLKSKHPLPISGFFLQGTRRDIKYRFVSLNDVEDDSITRRISLPLPLRFADHPTVMIIIQSTNGLLLCKCSCSSKHFDTNYYVYNRSTKQNTLLPPIIDHVDDPSKSPHYKVFCLRRSNDSDLYHIEVYSSNEGPWRRVVSVPSLTLPPTVLEVSNTVFWNGAVHWFGHSSRDCLSFDIDQEKIKILPLPYPHHQQQQQGEEEEEALPDIGTLRFLDQSWGNLYFTEVNDLSSSNVQVYEMENDGSSWSLKHDVDLEPLAATFPEMISTEYYTNRRIYSFSVVGIVEKETILLHIPNKLVKYNFKDKTFKKICGFKRDAPGYEFKVFRKCFQFIESLANV